MKNLIKSFILKFTYKHIDESKLNVISIKLKEKDLSYFNLSSNSIISFYHNEKLYYFRECPKICSFNEYFNNSIDNFFKVINKNSVTKECFAQEIPIAIDFEEKTVFQFKKYIDNKKADKSFIKAMSAVDIVSKKCNFSIWENQKYDLSFLEKFGLFDLQKQLLDIAVYFLWYMRGISATYKTLKIACGKKYSYFSAVRSVSSRIIAEELHLEHMITDARWCRLELDNGDSVFGVLSESAKGVRMLDYSLEPNVSLQKELLNLNLLDLIMFQTDHGPNNYNAYLDDNGNDRVCAFDNDNPYTLCPSPFVTFGFVGCKACINKKGAFLRPCLDKNTADNINNLDFRLLKNRLKPYLNHIQIRALIIRIKKIKRAIDKSAKANSNFLLNISDWEYGTLESELSGTYGETYLTKAIKNILK